MPDSDQAVLTIAQINDYLDAFATAGDSELELTHVLGAIGGLRRCEICGLDWKQVDADESVVDLRAGVGRHQLGHKVWDGPLKSKSSRRVVDLPPFALEILERHRGEGRIIATEPDALRKRFIAAADSLGLPRTTVEALRNAYGSAARELGGDTRSIADNMGHADEKVTADRYIVKRSAPGKRLAATMETLRRKPSLKVPQVRVTGSDLG
jgi:integrase